MIQTIVTEFTIFILQNKFTTEFVSTQAIILKQLFATGSVKKVELSHWLYHMAYKLKKWRIYLHRSHQFTSADVNSLTQTHSFPLSDLSFIYHTALYFLSLLGFLGANSKHQDPRFSSANKVGVKSSNKLINVNADKDLSVRLLITSNLPERCAELWTVFYPIFTP